jgi:hypothetical protein
MVYLHGGSLNPVVRDMKAQIEHYVRSGYTVVWPLFCDRGNFCLDFDHYEDNLISATFAALAELETSGHTAPTRDRSGRPTFVYTGHSLGSIVGTRTTAKLGRMHAQDASVLLPSALVFHDPGGYEVKVGDFEIKKVFPLTPDTLASMPERLLVLITERLTFEEVNGTSSVHGIFDNAPIANKHAWVIPHQCVKATWGGPDYTCPAITRPEDERHWLFAHVYVSHHRVGERDTHLTPISQVAVFDRILACATEGLTGLVQPLCNGAESTYTGAWVENGGVLKLAAPLYPYPAAP